MSRISVKVDFVCGIKIEDACRDAIKLANKLDINVKFDFNDVLVIARSNNYIDSLIQEYYRVQKEAIEPKIVIVL